MVCEVTSKEQPYLFVNIEEFSIDSEKEYLRDNKFYREDIIKFREEHREHFPNVENFEDYLGTWRTNEVIWDEVEGFDDKFSKLIKM